MRLQHIQGPNTDEGRQSVVSQSNRAIAFFRCPYGLAPVKIEFSNYNA